MSTIYTTSIQETDCIGDSLDTINNNFDNLGTAIVSVSSNVANGSITPVKLSTGGPFWNSSGNVGIGTSSPTGGGGGTTVNIKGATAATLRIDNGAAVLDAFAGGNDAYIQNSSSTGSLRFRTGASTTERLRIGSDGVINAQSNPITNSPTTPKAWVSFDGSGTVGTNQTIYGQYNVSSVYKNSDGGYTVYYTNALPSAVNCIIGSAADNSNGRIFQSNSSTATYASISIVCISPLSVKSSNYINVVVFGL